MKAAEDSFENLDRELPVSYIRADRSNWDLHNLFVVPFLELSQHKELVRNIIARDLKVRYKRSFLGIAWTVLAPLMSMTVLWMVFRYALNVKIPHYQAYLLSGLITWGLFIQSSAGGTACILSSAALLQKVRLPRVIFPIAVVLNNLVNFAFAFCALVVVILITRTPLHWTALLAPFVLIPQILFCMGWTMTVSALSVFFRDLQYILEISLGALFYLTPILYAPEAIQDKIPWIVSLNPLAKFIHLFRQVVYAGVVPETRVYLIALSVGLAMFLIGWILFQRLQRKFIYWF